MLWNSRAQEGDPLSLQNQIIGSHHLGQIKGHMGGKPGIFTQMKAALVNIVSFLQKKKTFLCKGFQRNWGAAIVRMDALQKFFKGIAVLIQPFIDRFFSGNSQNNLFRGPRDRMNLIIDGMFRLQKEIQASI